MSTRKRSPGTSSATARIVSSEFTHAPAHGSIRQPGAARNCSTVASHRPGPSRGAGQNPHPGTGVGSEAGQPTGSFSVDGSVPTTGSMNSKPSSLARTDASAAGRGANANQTTPSA